LPSDSPVFDVGLLSPVTVGADAIVSDAAVLAALVDVEVALTRAWGAVGSVPADVVDAVAAAIADVPVDAADLARRAVSGGNPVIPLVGDLRAAVAPADRGWVHRGATSQDIVDTALALVARRAGEQIDFDLRATARSLAALARAHRDVPAAARTLTQHAVPTTLGARFASWLRGVRAARADLAAALTALPAQLGGAGGTLASAVVLSDPATARALPAAFAAQLALASPAAPWHVERRPVTRLGDALVAVTDALGVIAADVATASRTEIGELSEGVGGGSSAMPQKRNPAASVLVRSAALRAPQLAATLHLAAAGAVDERREVDVVHDHLGTVVRAMPGREEITRLQVCRRAVEEGSGVQGIDHAVILPPDRRVCVRSAGGKGVPVPAHGHPLVSQLKALRNPLV